MKKVKREKRLCYLDVEKLNVVESSVFNLKVL